MKDFEQIIIFLKDNWFIIVAILGFFWNIIQLILLQTKDLKIEKIKKQLDIELLNDERFRKWYQSFVDVTMDFLHRGKELDQTEKWIIDFMKIAILFAWPDTIKKFGEYRKIAGKSNNSKDILLYMESLLSCMRRDLGVSNKGLKDYDLLQTLIVWDIEKALNSK